MPVRDNKEYLIFQEKYTNDKLIRKVIAHGGSISYYTNNIIPYYVLKQLAMHTESEVIFSIQKEYTDEQVENVELSYMATRVIIDCPMILPDMSPYDVLFALHDLKTNVDKIHLSFPPLTALAKRQEEYYEKKGDKYYVKASYKYMFFKYIQNSLSLWKMNIWMISDDDQDYTLLEAMIDKEILKRSPKPKKKAGAK